MQNDLVMPTHLLDFEVPSYISLSCVSIIETFVFLFHVKLNKIILCSRFCYSVLTLFLAFNIFQNHGYLIFPHTIISKLEKEKSKFLYIVA